MISFPDLLGWGAGLPGAEKPRSHALVVSHFTFKTYMSVNLRAFLAHIFHSAKTQIFKLNQRRKKLVPCMNVRGNYFFYFSSFSSQKNYKPQCFPPHPGIISKISALLKQKWVLARVVWVSLISNAYPFHQVLLKFKTQTSIVTK